MNNLQCIYCGIRNIEKLDQDGCCSSSCRIGSIKLGEYLYKSKLFKKLGIKVK